MSEESGWTTISVKRSVRSLLEEWEGTLSPNDKILKLLEIAKNPTQEQCDEYHVARDVFTLLNELCDHEVTIIDGRDKQKLIDEKLRELIEKAIQKKEHPEKWPSYNCPFVKKLDEVSGQCLKDTPDKRWSITASDCWACLKRGKINRQREGRYTTHEYIEKLGQNACPDCQGTGSIPYEHKGLNGRFETTKETCSKCKGKGNLT